jgi:Helicase conserved C-terminal domain
MFSLSLSLDVLANFLRVEGESCAAYHGGKRMNQRQAVQNSFMNNKVRVVVATVAFGMGLDKQDVGSVIHYTIPKTLENYVQEVCGVLAPPPCTHTRTRTLSLSLSLTDNAHARNTTTTTRTTHSPYATRSASPSRWEEQVVTAH